MPAANKRLWRQSGCMFAKSHACMSFSESQGGDPKGSFCVPSPARQSANRYVSYIGPPLENKSVRVSI
jgi:hypothetical protein